ncbi:FadR family transcriptional regulator [bacterium]|nr:FadR family transcriptional regulator [bacterium]
MNEKKNNNGRIGLSTTDWLVEAILERIHKGEWTPGMMIPSERTLIAEFDVSRLALREALSRLRALGVLEIRHGKGSTVRPVDAAVLGRLFPLMVSMQGEQTFQHVFEVRVGLELRTAALAAERRTDEDLRRLQELIEEFRANLGNPAKSVAADLEFHVQVARSTGNPLFTLLLQSISGFVYFVQQLACGNRPGTREAALAAHEEIAAAIRDGHADRARAAMESHLYTSAERILGSGVLSTSEAAVPAAP